MTFHEVIKACSNQKKYASTPTEGIEAELAHIKQGMSNEEIEKLDVKGKIVFTEMSSWRASRLLKDKGSLGLIVYSNPDYLKPEKNINSIQFKSIPQDTINKNWGLATSYSTSSKLLSTSEVSVVVGA